MRRDIVWLVVLLVVVASGFWLWSRPPARTAPSSSPVSPKPVQSPTAGLPDLVVTEVYWDDPYIRVHYRNEGGTEAPDNPDFLVKVSALGKEFEGNSNYRFPIPTPGHEVATGGFTIGLVDLEPGMTEDVTVTIDWEGRVREVDETNNQMTRRIQLSGPTLVKPAPDYHTAIPDR